MSVIETQDLTKRYTGGLRGQPVLAVDQITFSVEPGQVFGFLGPNGSGKTTTIGMLLGIITPTSGSFRLFGGSEPGELLAARQRVGRAGHFGFLEKVQHGAAPSTRCLARGYKVSTLAHNHPHDKFDTGLLGGCGHSVGKNGLVARCGMARDQQRKRKGRRRHRSG